MINYIITLILGMIMGFMLDRRFFRKEKEELNTDDCVDYLHSKGYYVKLSVSDKKGE